MNRYEPDSKALPESELNEIDRRVDEESKHIDVAGWVIKCLTVGLLWALYERLGKPITKNLAALADVKITKDHVYGRRRPGGALAKVENIDDVLPFNKVSRNMLRFALAHGAENVQKISDDTRSAIRMALVRAKMEGTPPKQLAEHLRVALKGIDRDWRRIVVTESAMIATNGYLLSQGEGQKLVGQSAHDACKWCKALIHGKVFTVTHAPPTDPKDPRWLTEVWPGKNNVGRVRHLKSVAGRVRLADELWMPVCPLHPSCRCRWVEFNPKFHEIDSEGFVKLRKP